MKTTMMMARRSAALFLCLLFLLPSKQAETAGNCATGTVYKTGDRWSASSANSDKTLIGSTNMTLACLGGFSATASQMQSTTDPYPSSAVSLATSAEGEISRLRYVLNKIAGWEGGYWYAHTTRAQLPNFNFTANGDQETWSAGTAVAPDSWTLTGVNATVAREATNFKIGTYAAAITRVDNDAYLEQIVSTLQGPAAWWRSKTVTLGVWVRATVASRARVLIVDSAGSTASSYHTGGSSFEHLTVTHTVAASATSLSIRLQVDTGNTTAQFDGVTLTRGSYVTDFFPSSLTGSAVGAQTQTFRNLHLRTHPDSDVAASKVMLVHADEIVMDDGTRVTDWDRVVGDITASGAGGLDAGSEAASTWYEIYAIRNTSGTKNLLLHRAKDYFEDETHTTEDGTHSLRTAATTNVKLAQGFKVDTVGKIDFIDVEILKAGAPTGNAWFTIESDSSGLPSGTALATSDKFDVSRLTATTTGMLFRIVFRNPMTTVAATQYHLVLQADYTASATVNIGWRADTAAGAYGNGSKAAYDGTTWTADADDDFVIKVYVTRNDTTVTMPSGYTQKALIGYVYNDGSSNFVAFAAKDRTVHYIGTNSTYKLGTSTSTLPALTSAAAYLPPRPVIARASVANGVADTPTAIGGVADGFGTEATPQMIGGVAAAPANATTAFPQAVAGEFATEYQGTYVTVEADTGHYWIPGYRW